MYIGWDSREVHRVAYTVRFPDWSTAYTSYGEAGPLAMPGDPIGIPGTASPATGGRVLSRRMITSAGTWPSMKYPSTTAV